MNNLRKEYLYQKDRERAKQEGFSIVDKKKARVYYKTEKIFTIALIIFFLGALTASIFVTNYHQQQNIHLLTHVQAYCIDHNISITTCSEITNGKAINSRTLAIQTAIKLDPHYGAYT